MKNNKSTRRGFLKKSVFAGAAVTAAGLSVAQFAHAQGNSVIKIGLIGCGGRGTGAVREALQTGKDVNIVAVGDYFKSQAEKAAEGFQKKFPDQYKITKDQIFDGFDNYKGVIASDADVILIACAAKFHPLYSKLALEAGKHVFTEKPNAIDASGIHVLEEAVAIAKRKNLSFLAGLQSRFCPQNQALVEQIHNGVIGDVKMIQSTFLRVPYGVRGIPEGMSELDVQVRNQYKFRWLAGDDFTQSLVHNVDRMTWVLGGKIPTSAFGMGGRASMLERKFGDTFDHHATTFIYPNEECRLFAFCRTATGCYNSYDDLIVGTKGVAYWNDSRIVGEKNWQFNGRKLGGHAEEQAALFKALREGKRLESDAFVVNSSLMAILGQVASYTGKLITWKELYDSNFVFKPTPEECVAGMEPPVKPDANGLYPVPIPGQTKWW
ncbi:MAG: Gfo/Idh/MocA family oxidoreductase [Planctomycetaceae bacterium]|jgi:predicted dehydrogenase|nr:Gfo/Idh/MocA family oxidoreductase [Planctomycetaceae bacterium]